MKIEKFNEKLKMTNFSDMENWSGKKEITYTGNKKIDYELGSKVIDLLEEYNIGIITIGPGKWLHGQKLLLPDERNFQEYRVQLGKKQDWDDFLNDYENDNEVDYNKLNEKEKEKINNVYNELPYEEYHNASIEFSIFLPNNITDINEAAMSDASTYLKLLNDSGFNLFSDFNEYDVFYYETIPTKNFINGKNIVITNNNLESINTISYRLHKDGKIFSLFEEFVGKEVKELFKYWINLIK